MGEPVAFWSNKRVTVTGGAGFLGTLRLRGAETARLPGRVRAAQPRVRPARSPRRCAACSPTRRPDVVIHLAAVVGGIGANRANPGRFFYDNLMMGAQLMRARRGSPASPSSSPSAPSAPIRSTRRCRSARRISGTATPRRPTRPTASPRRCCSCSRRRIGSSTASTAIFLLPVNLYGPGDNFDPATSHVIPALIRKCVEAVDRGATGDRRAGAPAAPSARVPLRRRRRRGDRARRRALRRAEPVNIGTGVEIRIRDLVDADRQADRLPRRDPLGREQARRPAAPLPRHQPRQASCSASRRRLPSRPASRRRSTGFEIGVQKADATDGRRRNMSRVDDDRLDDCELELRVHRGHDG